MGSKMHSYGSSIVRRGLVSKLYWDNILCIFVLHVGAVAAFWHFSWSGLTWCILLWQFIGGVGVCVGYHRLLTHHAFKTFKSVEYFLTIIGTMSWESSPIRWVGQHRIHHGDADGPTDPHTPNQGFEWAHVFWTFWEDPAGVDYRAFARDLERNWVHRLIDRYHRLFNLFSIIGLGGLGWLFHADCLSWILWGVCVRGVLILQATWLVNSVGHCWGYRNYKTNDFSRNNAVVAFLSFGEGWHNNHHASPQSARQGVRWFEIDPAFLTILVMKRLGLAWEIKGFRHSKSDEDKGTIIATSAEA